MGSPFNLRNGSMLLSTEAPGGVYNSAQLKKIAGLAESNAAIIRATEDQRIALVVAADKVGQIAKELKATGLGVRHYQDGMHQPVACIGALCPDHQQDALSAAMDITQTLAEITSDTPIKIGINGCATCCVPCHTYDVSVIGDTNGYRISLGGKNSQIPEMATFMAEGVPPEKLPILIKKIVMLYKEHAQKGERLQEVMERVGSSSFVAALAPYSQDAAGSDPFAGGAVSEPDNSASDEIVLDETDLSGLVDEAAEEAAEIVSDAATLEPMEELTVPVESQDTSNIIDDIDPQSFGGGDLSSDVLIADGETEFEEPAMTAAEAYENAATDDGALDLGSQDLAGDSLAAEDLTGEMTADLDTDLDAGLGADLGAEMGADLSADLGAEEIPESIDDPAVSVASVASGEEVSGEGTDDEDEIERKLTASIDETGATPIEEDENAADREAAANMIDSVSAVADDDLAGDDFSNPSDQDLDNASPMDPGDADFAGGESALEFESIGQNEDGSGQQGENFESDVAVRPAVLPLQPNPMIRPAASGWQISAVDVGSDGKYVLQFNSGAQLRIDPNEFSGSRKFTFAGKAVAVTQQANGINIAVDGIEMFVPQRSAA